jgi:hypothetical protein
MLLRFTGLDHFTLATFVSSFCGTRELYEDILRGRGSFFVSFFQRSWCTALRWAAGDWLRFGIDTGWEKHQVERAFHATETNVNDGRLRPKNHD